MNHPEHSKRKLGRSTVLTPEVIQQLCDIIADANTFTTAYTALGIGKATFYKRMSRDVAFRDAIARAQSQAKQMLLGIIKKAAITDWRAAAWINERTYRDEYGKVWADEHPGARIEVNINADEHAQRLREIFGVKQAQVIDAPALPDVERNGEAKSG